jgi:hypothetical protein
MTAFQLEIVTSYLKTKYPNLGMTQLLWQRDSIEALGFAF